jgi:hypothetical protein
VSRRRITAHPFTSRTVTGKPDTRATRETTHLHGIGPSPGYARIFDFRWPSTFYAIDIVAWDVFFALAVLFAVPAFARQGKAKLARQGLIASGSLSLIGLIGPFADALGWRTIGILGYTVVFGLTCVAISRVFKEDAFIETVARES